MAHGDRLRNHVARRVSAWFTLVVLVWAAGGCHRHPTNAPADAALAGASTVPKPVVRKTKYWDGSVGLVHPDGSNTIAIWPMQIREGSDRNAAVPVGKRCERIAQGAPYSRSNAQAAPSAPRFEALESASLREFDRVEVERTDPCASEFGPKWHVPSIAEFDAYAAQLARAGSWFLRTPSGTMKMVDYAPPIQLRIAEVGEVPARVRTSLANTAHVFCLSTVSAAAEPPEPSRGEIDRCVRRFYAPQRTETASIDFPDLGLSRLLAVRLACRQDGPDAEWLRVLESTRPKVGELAEALVDPERLDVPLDQKTEEYIDALFLTMHVCLEQPLHPSARSHAAILARLDELETILQNAHEQREALRQRQRTVEVSRPLPMPAPETVLPPKIKRCNCAESDLACNMRCAARH